MYSYIAYDWGADFNVGFSHERLEVLASVLFNELNTILQGPCPFVSGKTVQETHFVFMGQSQLNGQPLTLTLWDALHPLTPPCKEGRRRQPCLFTGKFSLSGEQFAEQVVCADCLYLVPTMYPLTGLVYEQQVANLPPGYEVSSANEAVQAQLLHFRKALEYFGYANFGRTSDRSNSGTRVTVGGGDLSSGIIIANDYGGHSCDGLGVAVHRKVALVAGTIQ